MSASFKLDGLAALEAKLTELDAEVAQRALVTACRKAMQPVLDDAKDLVPIWSGALRDAIKLSTGKPKDGATVAVAGLRIGSASSYNTGELPPSARWHFVEYGTSTQPARPFLRPALDKNADGVLDTLKKELAAAIKRAIKRGGGK